MGEKAHMHVLVPQFSPELLLSQKLHSLQFMFHLHHSQFLQMFNSPDELLLPQQAQPQGRHSVPCHDPAHSLCLLIQWTTRGVLITIY